MCNKFIFQRISLRFGKSCQDFGESALKKLWHDQVDFSQQWEMGCYFGNSQDAFAWYGKNLVILTKVGVLYCLPYVSVHKNHKILIKLSYNLCKVSHANRRKINGIFPIYFEVALWYHNVPPAMSLLLLGHAANPSIMWLKCVVSLGDNRGFLATMYSHREWHTWACCCEKGESNNKGFRMSEIILLDEKYECQLNRQNIS
jgi:hypothetical protein